MTTNISAPEPLKDHHNVNFFNSGEISLDDWIRKRALKNERNNASRTFIVCEKHSVIGYYALAVGSVEHKDAPPKLRKNMPNPIPVMILGRLAIDQSHQNKKLGSFLLRDALLRTLSVSRQSGIKAIMVNALSDKAKAFYMKYGFRESPIDERLLFITVAEVENSL